MIYKLFGKKNISNYFFLIILFLILNCTLNAKELAFVENGRSDYRIYISDASTDSTRYAAIELQRLLKKSTGVKLEITSDWSKDLKYFVIGKNNISKRFFKDLNSLENDSYIIGKRDDNLFLIGRDDDHQGFYQLNILKSASVGSYYAVIDFSRRFLGAAWYMPGQYGEEIKKLKELKVTFGEDIKGGPYFSMRYIDGMLYKSIKYQQKLKDIGNIQKIYYSKDVVDEATKWGRHLRLGSNFELNVGHAWYQWIPHDVPSKYVSQTYGKSNPDFFSIDKNSGINIPKSKHPTMGNQLCICNEGVAEEYAKNIISYALKTGKTSYSLSANDGGWKCNCQCCKEKNIDTLKKDPKLSAELIKFANSIAEDVVEEIPDATFGLYAYDWAQLAPLENIKSRKEIYISDVHNGLAYGLYNKNKKESAFKIMKDWREHSEKITLTSYFSFYGNYSFPLSSINKQYELIDFLSSFPSSVGMRMNYALLDSAPVGVLGPDPWVLSELLWNPHQSLTELKNQYYYGAFGIEAGTYIKAYFELIDDAISDYLEKHPVNSPRDVPKMISDVYIPIMIQCNHLIAKAVDSVSEMDYRYKWRVSRVATGWEYAELTLNMIKEKKKLNYIEFGKLKRARDRLLESRESEFSLSRVSLSRQETIVPLF